MKHLPAQEISALNDARFKTYRRSVTAALGRAENEALKALDIKITSAGSAFYRIEREYNKLKPIVATLALVEADKIRRWLEKKDPKTKG